MHKILIAVIEVLYLSYDGMTDPLGQSQVIPYLIGLSSKGYRFHLISFEKAENYKEGKEHVSNLLKQHSITWYPLTYTKSPPVLSTIYDLSRMKAMAEELIRALPVKIIHCRSYISGLAGMAMKKKYGVKFIFDMRGFYADERVDGGLWPQNNPVFKLVFNYFKKKEKQMLLGADAVICLTNNAAGIIQSWKLKGDTPLPIQVIPCCADLDLFNALGVTIDTKADLKAKHHLTNIHPVISYLGAIGTWYMLDEMLEMFRHLLHSKPNAVFLFITHEPAETVFAKVRDHNIPESQIRVVKATRSEVPALLSLSDAAVFFIKPTFSKQASSPTKQGEIMGMGIPVICNTGVGDTDFVINNYGAGMAIDLNTNDAYQQIADQFDAIAALPAKAIRTGAEDFYSLKKGVEKYESVYKQLLGK